MALPLGGAFSRLTQIPIEILTIPKDCFGPSWLWADRADAIKDRFWIASAPGSTRATPFPHENPLDTQHETSKSRSFQVNEKEELVRSGISKQSFGFSLLP